MFITRLFKKKKEVSEIKGFIGNPDDYVISMEVVNKEIVINIKRKEEKKWELKQIYLELELYL